MIGGGIPICLAYSNKGEDLNERFGMPGANAATFHPEDIVAMAETSTQQRFDPEPLRLKVEADFGEALKYVKNVKLGHIARNNSARSQLTVAKNGASA